MRKFNKATALSLVVALSLSLCSCGKQAVQKTDTDATTSIEASISQADTETTSTSVTTTTSEIDEESAQAEQEKFDNWCMEQFKKKVTSDSITLNYDVAHPEDYDIAPMKATLGDADTSLEAEEKAAKNAQETLDELDSFNYALLTDTQKYTYDVYYEDLSLAKEGSKYHYFFEPFAYTSGIQVNYPIAFAEYNFRNKQDIDTYIELINQYNDFTTSYLKFEKEKSAKGLFMSASNADEVIRQCQEYIDNPEDNLLISTFNSRIEAFEGLSKEEIEAYKKKNHDAVMNSVIPAYKNIIKVFTVLKNTGKNHGGICNFENGKEYYAYALKATTGSDKTPEEVIAILDNKFLSLFTALSAHYLQNASDLDSYTDSSEGMYETFTDYVGTINRIHEAAKDKFPEMPEVTFTSTPVHKSLEGITSPAFYMTPAIDEYTTNSIYINQASVDNNSLWSTLAHEGVPGHMYQFTYYLNTKPTPLRTELHFNGYTEGWATYTELMSFDLYDKYPSDACAKAERINQELTLILSARSEIGVNYEGWTYDDLDNYFTKLGLGGQDLHELYNYVSAEPINYQMYVLGYLEFKELREHAEEELGDKFDEVAFHKVLLDAGPSQFYLLRNLVDKYIEENK